MGVPAPLSALLARAPPPSFTPSYTLSEAALTQHPLPASRSVTHQLQALTTYATTRYYFFSSLLTFRSCRPACLEMDRKFCPTATTSYGQMTGLSNLISQRSEIPMGCVCPDNRQKCCVLLGRRPN